MKKSVVIIRWIVGLLFIFSGLIKANDPLGLSYKMQEFFEVWNWGEIQSFTLPLSIIMNVFEVVAGVAIIIGWRMKLFSWLLLLLIIFFSFLTGYAMFSGKIKNLWLLWRLPSINSGTVIYKRYYSTYFNSFYILSKKKNSSIFKIIYCYKHYFFVYGGYILFSVLCNETFTCFRLPALQSW